MSDPFVAEIRIVGFNFPPMGWAQCNGQLMAISQNAALFSLLGTTYGGDGRSTFGLPNLQGAAPICPDNTNYVLGQRSGTPTVQLTQVELPQHTHALNATANKGTTTAPAGASLAEAARQVGPVKVAVDLFSSAAPDTTLAPGALTSAGSSQPHNNMQPYLTLNFVIALQGVFPSRD